MSTIEFEAKFLETTSVLNAFAMSLTKNRENANDLFQETAFRAIKNKEKFAPGTNFKAWSMTIMKNIFINAYRKRMRSQTIFDATDNQYFLNSGSHSVTNNASGNILMAEVYKMIENLDEGLKKPFEMHWRWPYRERRERTLTS